MTSRFRANLIGLMALASLMTGAFVFGQTAVTVPAHTRVVLQTSDMLRLNALAAGDVVTLLLRRPIRAGKALVLPAGTPVRATVEQVQHDPLDFAWKIEPLRVGNVSVPLEGNVLPLHHGEPDETDEWMPPELAYGYWRPAPFRGDPAGNDPKDMLRPGFVTELRTSADVSIPADALPHEQSRAYRGDPVLYVSDRLREKHGRILCGKAGVLGLHHPDPAVLRVVPRTYVFHTDRDGEASVTIDAERDHRYLIYHGRDGLDAVKVDNRPELLDYLPSLNRPEDFFFDADALTGSDNAVVKRDLASGGCGLIKTLHAPRRSLRR